MLAGPRSVSYIEVANLSMQIRDVSSPPAGMNVTAQTASDDIGNTVTYPALPGYGVLCSDSKAGGPTSPGPLTKRTLTSTFTYNTQDSISSGGGSIGYTVYPVYISLSGPVQDSSGNSDILVGQSCTASLVGIPSGYSVSNYQWSVSGTTFQTWSADTPPFPIIVGGVQIGITGENPDATYEVDGPGPLTNPTAGWYWNDLGDGNGKSYQETVSCTATVTPPAGQGSAFTVSATQPVTVWTPKWTCTGTGASVIVNNTYISGSGFWLHAGPGPLDPGIINGMTWNANLWPPPSPVPFGTGSSAMVQIITSFDIGATTNAIIPLPVYFPTDGQTGLDNVWPYPWYTSAPNLTNGMYYESGDSPGVGVDGDKSAHDNESFDDYLMYCPPGSVQYVPLAKFIWSADMSATLPATGNWINFTGSAGTVTDAQKAGQFLPSNEFPSWTQIVLNQL